MHYLLGLAALVIGAVIATRRTRPTWFVVLTSVLVGAGALLAILSYTRVTDPLGLTANSILGWTFVGLSLITMLSAVFVLERRGEFGEERPPIIGDNPLDGDADDSDDLPPGRPHPDFAEAAPGRPHASTPPAGSTASGTAAGGVAADAGLRHTGADLRGAADGSPTLAEHAGAGAASAAAFGDGLMPTANEAAPADAARDADERRRDTGERPGLSPAPEDGHKASDAAAAGDRPGPSEGAADGTAVIGADPDIFTPPAETDVDAAPEGRAGTDRDDDGHRA